MPRSGCVTAWLRTQLTRRILMLGAKFEQAAWGHGPGDQVLSRVAEGNASRAKTGRRVRHARILCASEFAQPGPAPTTLRTARSGSRFDSAN